MENPSLFEFLNIKISTLIAGLVGMFLASLRKSNLTIQARLIGYAMACGAVIYIVPLLVFTFEYYNYPLNTVTENVVSFIFGMFAKELFENFYDEPLVTIKRWATNFKIIRRIFALPDSNPPEKKEQENGNKDDI